MGPFCVSQILQKSLCDLAESQEETEEEETDDDLKGIVVAKRFQVLYYSMITSHLAAIKALQSPIAHLNSIPLPFPIRQAKSRSIHRGLKVSTWSSVNSPPVWSSSDT